MSNDLSTKEYLTDRELAERLGFSKITLCHWRMKGEGPPYVRIGRQIRYVWTHVRVWLDRQTVAGAA